MNRLFVVLLLAPIITTACYYLPGGSSCEAGASYSLVSGEYHSSFIRQTGEPQSPLEFEGADRVLTVDLEAQTATLSYVVNTGGTSRSYLENWEIVEIEDEVRVVD